MINIRSFIKSLLLLKLVTSSPFNDTNQKKIEALEKEKNELMKQIHVAIGDSVSLLKDDNSTHSMQGVKYMLELKQQMQNLQNADFDNTTMEEDSHSELENRRKMKSRLKYYLRSTTTKKARVTTLDPVFDIETVLFGKKMSKNKLKQLIANREAMKKRLDEWILERELEKAKIKDRQLAKKKMLQSGLYEKCPRFGYGKKNKKKDYRRRSSKKNESESESEDPSKEKTKPPKKAKKGSKYPCCRKCCKKSYLGCL